MQTIIHHATLSREMIKALAALITSLLLLNCSHAVSHEQSPKAQTPAPDNLRGQIEKISVDAQGRVGASVLLLETVEAVSFNGDQKFPMQSVYKFPIGMAVLNQVDNGKLKLDQKVRVEKSDLVPAKVYSSIRDKYPQGGVELSVRELLRYMIVESDGTACDVLLRVVGGAERVNDYLKGLGVTGVVVATTEKEMAQGGDVQYRNWATPDAALGLLRAFYEGRGLSAASRALLLQLMTDVVTGPHRIKGQLPAGTVVAHKTGTSNTVDGLTRATNDIGIITLPDGRHLIVAIFVSDSKAAEDVREGVIARIARAAYDWATRAVH
ncbi:MAG TPA: class A beta-lactamase, subclass A2 [Pyrinomonadaceae bacterium]|nr:class A beta-lactamase, subclass A2 [Pyrinomonadaceae bacterium]